jgi:hypothetical protein
MCGLVGIWTRVHDASLMHEDEVERDAMLAKGLSKDTVDTPCTTLCIVHNMSIA